MNLVASLSALAMLTMPFAASANVMTFDDLPPGESYGLGSYTEDGITAFSTDFWSLPAGALHLDVGGVGTDNQSYSFKLGSRLFDLQSFDVIALGVPENAIGVVYGYDAADVLTYSSEFSIATSQTLSFTDWRGLSRLLIVATGDVDDHFSIDDLTLSATVPEPESWGLMLVGFAAVGAAARQRRERRDHYLSDVRIRPA